MLFPCPEGSVVGKSFQSEVEVHLKAKSRCEIRPEVGLEAAKSSFQSEVEVHLKAQSRCEIRPEVSPEGGKIVSFYRFRPQRLTIVSFLSVPAATFDTEDHPSTGQQTSFLSSPGHAVSLF